MIRSRRIGNFKSPSTASTTSLAQLHDKLSNLPYYEFTKEPVSVCAQPELSIVSENNESEISNSLESTSTLKLQRCAVYKTFRAYLEERKSQSDGEARAKNKSINKDIEDTGNNAKCSQSDNEGIRKDKKVVSSLFLATIGSANESLVSDIIERMPKDKPIDTDNLTELLIQEALQAKPNEERHSDSGINSGEPKKSQDSECIEDTQFVGLQNKKKKTSNNRKVASKSTSDESNTEPVMDTPTFVNVRKRNPRRKSVQNQDADPNTFDVQAVEDFFSQHFSENQMGDVIVSPTLAKKINETSSETSDDFLLGDIIENDFNVEIPDVDIVECLNSIVDKVCIEFEKCTDYLDKQFTENEILSMAQNINSESTGKSPLKEIGNIEDKDEELPKTPRKRLAKSKPVIKLKFGKKQKVTKKAKGKLKLEPVSKMSVILEDNNESDANKTNQSDLKKNSPDGETPLVKRKRKLYSPKDDQINFNNDQEPEEVTVTKLNKDVQNIINEDDGNDIADNFKPETVVTPKNPKRCSVTPKSAATCYKEIEKDRQKYRKIRKNKNVQSPLSPKSKKMDEVFEHLKDDIETHENIIMVDKKSDKDVAIFNFTSDSEDENFKQKKIEVKLRTSTTTVASGLSVVSTRRGRAVNKVNYTENGKSSSNESATKPVRRKRTTKRKNTKAKTNLKVDLPNLVDEKMRDAPREELNSSFCMNVDRSEKKSIEPDIQPPRLEAMIDEKENAVTKKVSEEKRRKPTKKQSYKTNIAPLEIIKDGEATASPLPGLIIEAEHKERHGEDSVSTNLVRKLQKYYKDGPDANNDTNTTQNMIFDNDMSNSPVMNITEELGRMMDAETAKTNNPSNKKCNINYDSDANTINDTMHSEIETRSKAGSTKSDKSKRSRLRLKTREKAIQNNDNSEAQTENKIKQNKDDKNDLNVSQKSKHSKVIRSSIEAVCTENARVTRSKSRSLSKSQDMVLIDLLEGSEGKSEKSIATVGINAHGDMDESPPNSKLLNERMSPRELQDMDQNIKDYYIELNSKVNVSKGSIEKSAEKAKGKKPETRSATSSAKKSPVKKIKLFDEGDYEISKWLPSVRDTESVCSETSQKTMSPLVSLKRLTSADIEKWIPSAKTTPKSSVASEKPRQILRRSPRINLTKKSHISPIKLDDFLPRSRTFDTSASKEDTFTTQETDTSRPNICKPMRFLRPTHQSSPISNSRESTPKTAQKRASPVNKSVESKKRKFDLDFIAPKLNLCRSSQSSNVDEWLKSLSTTSKVDNAEASSEVIQNIMEKIDTTLVEINQNTTKDFISLFVDAQRQLAEMKLERRHVYKQTAESVLSSVSAVLDQHFTLMDQRSSEQDDAFMSWLRERASEVLKRDCLQKRAMVSLLRDDATTAAHRLAHTH